MGHSEPCLAQLAIWSSVVKAYCIAPSFFSWDGRGTSRRIEPVTGRRPASLVAVGSRDVADLGEEVEMLVAGAARTKECGMMDVASLSVNETEWPAAAQGVPRSLRGANCRDSDNMVDTLGSELHLECLD